MELQIGTGSSEMDTCISSMVEFVKVGALLVYVHNVAFLQRMAILCLVADLTVDDEFLQNKWLSLSQLYQAKEADAEAKDASDSENDDEDNDDEDADDGDDDNDDEEFSEEDGSDDDGDPDDDAEANGDGGSDDDDDDDDDDGDDDDDDDDEDDDDDDDDEKQQPPQKRRNDIHDSVFTLSFIPFFLCRSGIVAVLGHLGWNGDLSCGI